MPFSENALKVLESRYLRRNLKGELAETPDELFMRVAKSVTEAELAWGTHSEFKNILITINNMYNCHH